MGAPKCAPGAEVLVQREPAAIRCLSCGGRAEADADEDARLSQRMLDYWLRPRSVECWPEYQDLIERRTIWPGAGWVKLPVAPQPKKRR